MNPELDLTVERVIRAPRAAVWRAWTDPDRFAQWWVPAPAVCRVERLDVRPGGALVTRLSEDGVQFGPHLDAAFLVVDELERLVFTNAIDSTWRPVNPAPIAMTAEIALADHSDGTDYRIVVRHADPAARALHERLGFADGWGTVTQQLAGVVESEVAR
ncbi:polyketide cyclase [Kribbella turkmenica]|uniref:Polyketide cyclase n=1 Tax=Kribbella turkmenica TaxID=2530375 RepID=A0A4R4XCV7_9ACTN|nr:SRPBCC domain-containing protein [Kribbella turkmenica]TDD28435.1 polyketide cyclase [Kribbella turkmenica]